jgi:hypothetical protein
MPEAMVGIRARNPGRRPDRSFRRREVRNPAGFGSVWFSARPETAGVSGEHGALGEHSPI